MRKAGKVLLLLVTVAAFAACSGTKELSTNPGALQADWRLASLDGTEVQMSQNYTLSFNTDGTVAGKADCNYFTGEYQAQQEGNLSMSAVNNTKVSCGSNSHSSNYLSSLRNAQSFEVRNGNQLVLNTGSGELVFNKVMPEGEGG
ncbi:MAG: META domain-containing protein [Balneolaceae bacterium]|nr:META domain-containing protein [Balneolaceae bacterium]